MIWLVVALSVLTLILSVIVLALVLGRRLGEVSKSYPTSDERWERDTKN